MTSHPLSLLLLTPLAGLMVLVCIPSRFGFAIRLWANVGMFLGLLASVPMLQQYRVSAAGMQLVERAVWIPSLGAQYLLGVDGISLLLVMLTAVLGFVATLCSWNEIRTREKQYYGLLFLQQTGAIGVFLALDFLLFYGFWEAVLIPMYVLIAIWGGQRRLYAALKFILYTVAGSVLMLVGGLALYFYHQQQFGFSTFELSELLRVSLGSGAEQLIFWTFFLAFAIKVPMWPFHTWLPDAHVEAPTAGSVLLAGVLLKMGTYGFMRFSLPLLPHASSNGGIVRLMVALSLIGILYGGLVSLVQKDWKRLIAYSSVSHMGFCTLGIFSGNPLGLAGSVLQQVSHGLATGMLFLVVGVVYERRHTRAIAEYGGLSHVMPGLAKVFAFAMLCSAGLPLLCGFVGEFTILRGAFEVSPAWAAWAVLGIVLSAVYLLWLYQRTMLGPITNPENVKLRDLSIREWCVFAPLIAWALSLGVFPAPYFHLLARPVTEIVQRVHPGYFAALPSQADRRDSR